MSYRERYAEIVKAGRRESKNIGQKAQNAVIDTFALMDEADATIAALTEKLRAVEAERDEAQAEVHRLANGEGCNQCNDHIISLDEDIAALRAELERKDAALRKAIPFIGYGAYVPEIVKMAEDALQPKEPPCQTA